MKGKGDELSVDNHTANSLDQHDAHFLNNAENRKNGMYF